LSVFEQYLQKIDYGRFLRSLHLPEPGTLVENIEYFTEKEAEKRDEILKGYFGKAGIDTIVDEASKNLQELRDASTVLDVGCGTGFFTTTIAEKLEDHNISFYALDATPAMLTVLVKKLHGLRNLSITPLLGVAERITESTNASQKVYKSLGVVLPTRFEAIISILMLHHCRNPSEVFSSMRQATNEAGKLILIDLCKHNFTEFREEMGDVHLGFELDYIKSELSKMFRVEGLERLPESCRCKESGRSADLFVATARAR
jgi:SAM-dependent methyltransferase